LLQVPLADLVDRADDQVQPAREVVRGRAARHAGASGDLAAGRGRVAELDEAADRLRRPR